MQQTHASAPMRVQSFGRADARIHSSTKQNYGVHFSHESLPSISKLNAAHGGVPHDLMQLQPQPDRQSVFEHPADQFARFQAGPLSIWIVVHRREQQLVYPL